LEIFFPIDNALYSIAFGTYKTELNGSKCRLWRWMVFAQRTVPTLG